MSAAQRPHAAQGMHEDTVGLVADVGGILRAVACGEGDGEGAGGMGRWALRVAKGWVVATVAGLMILGGAGGGGESGGGEVGGRDGWGW